MSTGFSAEQSRQTSRLSGHAVRLAVQSQDRTGSWPHDSSIVIVAGERGDSIITGWLEFYALRPLILVLFLVNPGSAFADKPPKNDGAPPGLAKKDGVPPVLRRRVAYRRSRQEVRASASARAYVAFDPTHDDRAWFLIDGRWILKQKFDSNLRVEVRGAMALDRFRHQCRCRRSISIFESCSSSNLVIRVSRQASCAHFHCLVICN
jgi:hypothetical protein